MEEKVEKKNELIQGSWKSDLSIYGNELLNL